MLLLFKNKMCKSEKSYIAIDLKSFYASVECVDHGLDPLTTNLVVADKSRTEKTICLAVSPSLKSYGIPGRARLFEVIQKVGEVNDERKTALRGRSFLGSSADNVEVTSNPTLALDYIVAPPRMRRYMDVSADVYETYLDFVSPDDIHPYSVDEVFIDASKYLSLYKCSAAELAKRMINSVLEKTGITATAGIGTNLFLAKIAMDIVAKKMDPDENGVRIAFLDEDSFKKQLWSHEPLTDFWQIGHGYSTKLASIGIHTMGDIAACSAAPMNRFPNEKTLYKLFGVNAELLIDHAWGVESTTIEDIKAYKPKSKSLSTGQVLSQPYSFENARTIVKEMTEGLVLDMVEKELVTDQFTLTVGYDTENAVGFKGKMKADRYGRMTPRHAHGTANLNRYSSSGDIASRAILELYDKIVNRNLTIRRIVICASRIKDGNESERNSNKYVQLSFFEHEDENPGGEFTDALLEKEKSRQMAILEIRKNYGKNAILKGFNFLDGATARERNNQVGGHKA